MLKTNETKLLSEQKSIYDKIIHAIPVQEGSLLFLFASGETEKFYLISLILAEIHSKGNMAVTITSTGITATCG